MDTVCQARDLRTLINYALSQRYRHRPDRRAHGGYLPLPLPPIYSPRSIEGYLSKAGEYFETPSAQTRAEAAAYAQQEPQEARLILNSRERRILMSWRRLSLSRLALVVILRHDMRSDPWVGYVGLRTRMQAMEPLV